MTQITDSVVATGGSKMKKVKIDKSIKLQKRKSFIWGFISGVAASLTASGIWHLIGILL